MKNSMIRLVEHYNAPSIYLAGPDDNWRTAVAAVTLGSNGDYEVPKETKFNYVGPRCACSDERNPSQLFMTERVWKARDADFVFGYLTGATDYMTIAEISFAVAMGVDVYLAVGAGVSDEALTALSFLSLGGATRVADVVEAKDLFEKTLNDVVKWEKRTFFTIMENEECAEESEKCATIAKIKFVCPECDSDDVVMTDVIGLWNGDTQQWEANYNDAEPYCSNCNSELYELVEPNATEPLEAKK